MRKAARLLVATSAAAALLLAGCHRQAGQDGQDGPEEREGAAALRGCYSLAPGGNAGSEASRLPPGALPRMLELDSVVAGTVRVASGEERPAYRAYSYLGTRRADHPFNRWTVLPGDDSLQVDHSGALAGLVLRLEAADSVLTGTVRGFTDVRAEGEGRSPAVPVRARPGDCPGAGT